MSETVSRTELDTWPQQMTRGHTIPGYRYTSAAFFEMKRSCQHVAAQSARGA